MACTTYANLAFPRNRLVSGVPCWPLACKRCDVPGNMGSRSGRGAWLRLLRQVSAAGRPGCGGARARLRRWGQVVRIISAFSFPATSPPRNSERRGGSPVPSGFLHVESVDHVRELRGYNEEVGECYDRHLTELAVKAPRRRARCLPCEYDASPYGPHASSYRPASPYGPEPHESNEDLRSASGDGEYCRPHSRGRRRAQRRGRFRRLLGRPTGLGRPVQCVHRVLGVSSSASSTSKTSVVGACWRWAPAIPMPRSGASSCRCGQRDIPVPTWSPDQESMWSAQRSACSIALLPDPSTW